MERGHVVYYISNMHDVHGQNSISLQQSNCFSVVIETTDRVLMQPEFRHIFPEYTLHEIQTVQGFLQCEQYHIVIDYDCLPVSMPFRYLALMLSYRDQE